MNMKFLIIGDLHGKMPKIHFKNFDAIIAPGDFCSDKRKDLVWKAIKESEKEKKKRKEKNEETKKRDVKTKSDNEKSKNIMWYDLCGKKEAKKMIDESVASGRKILEYLNSLEKPVFIVPGNWDYPGIPENLIKKLVGKKNIWSYWLKDYYKNMRKGLNNIHDLNFKLKTFGEIDLIGYGIFHIGSGTAPEDEDDFLYAYFKLYHLFKKAKQTRNPIIFLSHNVPYNTKIDKILNKKSPAYGEHYGSVVVKELIKNFQPLVNIGGHIHEHFGKTRIKKTICINAGFGSHVNTLLEIELSKKGEFNIKRLEFYDENG